MERILYLRLVWYIESRNILPEEQFGFRRSRSCGDSLSIFACEVKGALVNEEKLSAVFLDIASAFDNVDPFLLLEGMILVGFPRNLAVFIFNLLRKRKIKFLLDGELSDSRFSFRGTPQGSILSPLLFNIFIRELPSCLPFGVRALQYADDLVIWSRGRDSFQIMKLLTESIERLDSFLGSRGLGLSASKSRVMHFSRGGSRTDLGGITLGGETISPASAVRFLGITIDSRCSGGLHFENTYKKCRSIVNVISSLSGIWWGAHPVSLLTIYRSLLRSVMEYGHQVFIVRGNASRMTRLLRLQYRAIRAALGYRISTPINVMLDEAKEPPLLCRLNFLNSRFIYKNLARSENAVIQSLQGVASVSSFAKRVWLLERLPTLRAYIKNRDDCELMFTSPSLSYFSSSYEGAIFRPSYLKIFIPNSMGPHESASLFLDSSADLREGALTFYTDGSKRGGESSVEAGIFSPELNLTISLSLPAGASIFSAEAWALLRAAEVAFERGIDYSKICFFSDSRSVLEAVCSCNPFPLNYIISRIKDIFHQFASSERAFYLVWIPAHRGILGNETADALAKEATLRRPAPEFRIPFTDFLVESRLNLRSSMEQSCELPR
ncbi:PREDICTED: RNA-directed DNA polymerase from mobile element jockey-like [Vollenhovia emeryi]|uniref:RNA-directed DNA polymerase from mobile element jockey-like n=1 Tax=Vollenhovia emeryi TaxID=411798 RepID=UPI0005F3D25F|nr:PREDICTED: RNA-directed DNA polymerase from mobile element jockey-like [Vollenhovia emeryi]